MGKGGDEKMGFSKGLGQWSEKKRTAKISGNFFLQKGLTRAKLCVILHIDSTDNTEGR